MTMSRRTLLATALVLAPMMAMAQTTPPLTAEQMAYYSKPFQDARFAGFARTANDFEIQSANLALQKSTNEMVRGVATRATPVFTDAGVALERNRNEAGVTGIPDEDFKDRRRGDDATQLTVRPRLRPGIWHLPASPPDGGGRAVRGLLAGHQQQRSAASLRADRISQYEGRARKRHALDGGQVEELVGWLLSGSHL